MHATADVADRKQRQLLQHAARRAEDAAADELRETLERLRARVAVPRRSLPAASESDRNPVAVLLREYLRMLKAGDAEVVDFGDADVAVRGASRSGCALLETTGGGADR